MTIFTEINTKAIAINVSGAYKKAGFQKQSFNSTRHFMAIQLTNRGVPKVEMF
ncbi:hypothetical protein OAS18_03600 [Nitrospinaceae bacterium]|nr:hypothetical protein [Nitrospinaceae bacterium]